MTHTERHSRIRFAICAVIDGKAKPETLNDILPELDEGFKALGSQIWDLDIEPEPEVRDFTQPEPQPEAGKTVVADLVLADINQRVVDGERKYGTKLMTHNGRKPLADAYQEAIDLVFYLRQELEERKAATELVRRVNLLESLILETAKKQNFSAIITEACDMQPDLTDLY